MKLRSESYPDRIRSIAQGEACAVLESVKAASDIYAPVSGEVIQANGDLEDSPEQVNSEGSYLFEPAMSVHTLTVDASTTEPTEVWFAIYGANINLDKEGHVTAILDAATVLDVYRQGCAAQGLSCEATIVVGENLTVGV
jgi:hypothetical protein